MDGLLRKTLATFRPDEVAFVYIPKERIDETIFSRRFGQMEADENGVTYSLTKSDLDKCFSTKKPSVKKFSWIVSVSPLTARYITSIAVPDVSDKTCDPVIALYAPAFSAATVGTTVVHFIMETEANAFVQRLQNPIQPV